MDVARSAWPFRLRLTLLIAGLHLAAGASTHADPMYTAIDLGTGNLTYGVDSGGNGTDTGSNGQTYLFNPAKNYLPSQWANTSAGVPLVQPAPVWNPYTYSSFAATKLGLTRRRDWPSPAARSMSRWESFCSHEQAVAGRLHRAA